MFSNFSNFQNFSIFCQENSEFGRKRHFYEMILFDTHSTVNLPPLSILKKNSSFSSKKPVCFSKKTPNFWTLRILNIPVAFYNLLQFYEKNNFTFRSVNKLADVGIWRERNGQTWGKKRRKWSIWEEEFALIFLRYWRIIIKIQSLLDQPLLEFHGTRLVEAS